MTVKVCCQLPHFISIFAGPDSKLNLPVTVKNSTWLSVNLGNPFRGSEVATLQLRFNPKKDMNESIVVFHINVKTSSYQDYDTSTFTSLVIVRRAEVKVVGATAPERVHYAAEDRVKGESAMQSTAFFEFGAGFG